MCQDLGCQPDAYARPLAFSDAHCAVFVLFFEAAAAIPETLCGRITNGKGGPVDVDDNLAVPVGSGLLLRLLLAAFFPHLIL